MKLLISFITALIVSVVSSWIIGVTIASHTDMEGGSLYSFIMLVSANIVVPIFLTACLLTVIKKKIKAANPLVKYLAQVGIVLLIMVIGVILGSISQTLSYYGDLSALTRNNLVNAFDKSYKGYMPHIALDALLVPVVYYWLTPLNEYYKKDSPAPNTLTKEERLESMLQRAAYFERHAKDQPLFTPEWEAATAIHKIVSETKELSKEEAKQILDIVRQTEAGEHYDGSGWFDYKIQLYALLTKHGFAVRLHENKLELVN